MFYFVEEVVSYTHRAGDNVLPHTHEGCEVIVYASGAGVATVESEEFNYIGPALLLVPAGKRHFERTLSSTKVRSCVFRTDYLEVRDPVMIASARCAALVGQVYDSLGGMAELYFDEGERRTKELENILAETLFGVRYLCELHDSNFSDSAVSVCNNAKNYISANFNRNIRFEILAERVGYSYDRFRHIFVNVVGMGPKAYLQGVRMSNAKEMLTFTSRPVHEIAARCGYSNPVVFMNYFKRSMGITPSQYRKFSRMNANNRTFNLSDLI